MSYQSSASYAKKGKEIVSSISVQNRFTPLNPKPSLANPQTSYKEALRSRSPRSPSSTISSLYHFPSLSANSPSTDPLAEYFFKEPDFPLVPLEEASYDPDPLQAAKNVFYLQNQQPLHYSTNNLQKTREFYEHILIDTNSIRLRHTKENETIKFSKIIILKVMDLKDWNKHPLSHSKFSVPYQPEYYNYYDYQSAWYNMFWLRPKTHSWFIFFTKGCQMTFPDWFLKWWTMFKFPINKYPPEVLEGYQTFQRQVNISTAVKDKQLQFHIIFSVPWILAWDYSLKEMPQAKYPYLARRLLMKWWKVYLSEKSNEAAVLAWISKQSQKSTVPLEEPSPKRNLEKEFVEYQKKLQQEIEDLKKQLAAKADSTASPASKAKSTSNKESSSTTQSPSDHLDSDFEDEIFCGQMM